MMAQEIVTSIQEGYKLNIVLLDNHGFSSIGGLSRACGNDDMGTNYRFRRDERYDGGVLPSEDFCCERRQSGSVDEFAPIQRKTLRPHWLQAASKIVLR